MVSEQSFTILKDLTFMRTVLEKFTLLASRKPRLAAISFFPVSSVFVCSAKNGVPVKTPVSLKKGKFCKKDANAIEMWSTFELYYCSAHDWERSGLLEGIPKVVVQISALL
jgi:hypothetical protein